MSNKLVSTLKPWVSTFSEAIRYHYKHSDSLTVGGRITHIFNVAEITHDDKDMVQITVDDGVGETWLMIPSDIYKEFNNKHNFKEDMIVLADGKLLDPEGLLDPKKVKTSKRNSIVKTNLVPTLICWKLETLKEDVEPKKQEE